MGDPLLPELEALPPFLPAPTDSVAADDSVPDLIDGCQSCASYDDVVQAASAMVLPWGVKGDDVPSGDDEPNWAFNTYDDLEDTASVAADDHHGSDLNDDD